MKTKINTISSSFKTEEKVPNKEIGKNIQTFKDKVLAINNAKTEQKELKNRIEHWEIEQNLAKIFNLSKKDQKFLEKDINNSYNNTKLAA